MKRFVFFFYTLLLFFLSAVVGPLSAKTKTNLILLSSNLQIPSDGKTLCSTHIQQAIDRIAKKGRGTLVLTPGTYLSGSIFLKTGVILKLEKGATLLGSANPYDYKLVDVGVSGDDTRHDNACMALLMAHQVILEESDYRPAIVADDVESLVTEELQPNDVFQH